MNSQLDQLLESAATEIYTAIADALTGAGVTFKQDVGALFTKAKLLQWVTQFPSSLATIGASIVVAGLDFFRNAAQAIPQGIVIGTLNTVLDLVPLGDNTKVCTERQAIKGAINLFRDAYRSVATSNLPFEVIIANKVRSGSALFKLIKVLTAGSVDKYLTGKVIKAITAAILSMIRVTITIGGAIVLMSMAVFMIGALAKKPLSYFKPLSQAKGRAWVTTRDFQRI